MGRKSSGVFSDTDFKAQCGMKILSKINLLLLFVCGALGYLLYQEVQRPPDRVPSVSAAPSLQTSAGSQTQSAQHHAMPPRQQFSQLIARPPFSATRRPPQPRRTVVVTKPQPIARPKILLVGTFVNSASGVAVIQKLGVEKQIRLSLGETIDGWKLETILPDRIFLTSKDDELEVRLREPSSSKRQ